MVCGDNAIVVEESRKSMLLDTSSLEVLRQIPRSGWKCLGRCFKGLDTWSVDSAIVEISVVLPND